MPAFIPDPIIALGDISFEYFGTGAALQTVLTPAANINGIIITQLNINVFNKQGRIFANQGIPATFLDGPAVASYSSTGGAILLTVNVGLPILVNAGWGLYYQNNGVAPAFGDGCEVTYRLL